MSDATIKSLGNGPDHQEILITSMEIAETGVSEDRITALEKKVSAMEIPIRGLIDDLLDFKAITRAMSLQSGNPCIIEFTQEPVDTADPVSADPSASPLVAASGECNTGIRQQGARNMDLPVTHAKPAMVRIMQSDGTTKMEIRRGDSTSIDAGVGYGRARNLRC